MNESPKVGDNVTFHDRKRDSNFNRIGGLQGQIIKELGGGKFEVLIFITKNTVIVYL